MGSANGWMTEAPGAGDRIEGCFSGAAFAPHRHDTYAIGITLDGVQSFDYRGARRDSLPGGLVVLHPDEPHDGRAGDSRAFRYRLAYVPPGAIQTALAGRSLPFVEGGVSADPSLRRALLALLGDFERPLAAFEYEVAIADLAAALERASGARSVARIANRAAARRARDYIEDHLHESLTLDDLEQATGHDRWQLSRDFRVMFGTSPYRYLIMRRLDEARRMMLAGYSGAEAAHGCGFADQSHFSRLFKRSFGLTPGAWRRAVTRTHDHSRPA